jgi:hypothetical protein
MQVIEIRPSEIWELSVIKFMGYVGNSNYGVE